MADSKMTSSKPMDMIKAGGSGSDSAGEETGSSRSYPKSGKVNTSVNLNPMNDKRRGGTDWVVGGV